MLWVKGGGLVPPDVGMRIRSYYLLRELAQRHQITLFTFYAAHPNDQHQSLAGMFERLVCMPLKVPDRRSAGEYAKYAASLFSSLPYSVRKYCGGAVRDALRHLVKGASFDVAVCDFILPAVVFPWEVDCPKIIFTHNVETLIWKRHVEVARNPLWKLIARREHRNMAVYERKYLSLADHILAVSDVDRVFFNQLLKTVNVSVIPTGVDVEYFAPLGPATERPGSLVFVGSMDWLPNEEGVSFFIEQVLPAIRRQIPEASLTVVGRSPSEKLRSLASKHGVHVTGTVDDVRPYMREAAVYIVPLRVGSGTRLKIFEAMAMAKAITSTTLGAEGLPVADGENLLLADTPEDFARKTVRLLRNPEERTRLGTAARQLVTRDYSWAAVSTHIDEVFQRLTESSHAAEAGNHPDNAGGLAANHQSHSA